MYATALGFLNRFKLPLALVAVSLVCMFLTYRLGISHERQRSSEAAMNLIQQRDDIDGEIQMLDDAGLCRKLGLKWVRGNCE